MYLIIMFVVVVILSFIYLLSVTSRTHYNFTLSDTFNDDFDDLIYKLTTISEKDIEESSFQIKGKFITLFHRNKVFYRDDDIWYKMSGLKAKEQYKLNKLLEALKKREEIRKNIMEED